MSVSKVMIKKWGEPSAEWEKVGTIIRDSITVSKPEYIQEDPPKAGRLSFTFRVNIRHKTTVWIGQLFGVLKKPKCTYRTIRRDCAKRNRR